jgi:hypothetical protein
VTAVVLAMALLLAIVLVQGVVWRAAHRRRMSRQLRR